MPTPDLAYDAIIAGVLSSTPAVAGSAEAALGQVMLGAAAPRSAADKPVALPHVSLAHYDDTSGVMVNGVQPINAHDMRTSFYDATTAAISADPTLQAALDKLFTDDVHYSAARSKIAVSLVDLSGALKYAPRYAGINDTHEFYAASCAKVCGMVAVYQLLADVNDYLSKHAGIGDMAALAAALKAEYQSRGLAPADQPQYSRIFDFEAGPPARVKLNPELLSRLAKLSEHNLPGTTPILLLRYPFIASTMIANGLFSPANQKGLWLSLAYGGMTYPGGSGVPETLPRWTTSWYAPGWGHNVNAVSMAQFLTLCAQGRLVDPASSSAMLQHLATGGCFSSSIDVSSLTASGEVHAKCGILGEPWVSHDAVHYRASAGNQELVIVLLTRDHAETVSNRLFSDLLALF